MTSRILALTCLGLLLFDTMPATAREPHWSGAVVARGQQRVHIQSSSMIHRPYRPLHVYGNTVRRRHYRGTAVPLPRDFYEGLSAFITRQ